MLSPKAGSFRAWTPLDAREDLLLVEVVVVMFFSLLGGIYGLPLSFLTVTSALSLPTQRLLESEWPGRTRLLRRAIEDADFYESFLSYGQLERVSGRTRDE